MATSEIRASFVEHFGEDEAVAVENAAAAHAIQGGRRIFDKMAEPFVGPTDLVNVPDGADHFQHALLIAIGHECVSKYRQAHGITTKESKMKQWAREHAHLDRYDGPMPDPLADEVGAYSEWLPDGNSDEEDNHGTPS